jgi:methylthioribose-1-phosphate isomerase
MVRSIEWCGDSVRFLDQTKLPLEEIYTVTKDYRKIAEAIRRLEIRGAPLIGIAAAYGVALAGHYSTRKDHHLFVKEIQDAADELASTRPTAINLFWALERMRNIVVQSSDMNVIKNMLIEEAIAIHREDKEMCRRIGENGARLIPETAYILTHCNTGALATGGEGTAQSVITTAARIGKKIRVYADETRPLLQGARLTTWELMKNGINVTLITDNVAAFLMQQKKIDLVITGSDRITANGDAANKIGTYSIAVQAKYHGIPFYIAAPTSTIDPSLSSGDAIPIEERNSEEITNGFGLRTAPDGVQVYAPAFDVTPASLISAIITDRGVFYPPYHFLKIARR